MSGYIKEAFPTSLSKRSGHNRETHIFGLQAKSHSGPSTSTSQTIESTALQENLLLRERIKQLQVNECSSLKAKVEQLETRLQDIEQYSPVALSDQPNHLMSPSNAVYHGPNTIQHFTDFSMEALIAECNQHAPDLLRLLNELGQTDRHRPEEGETSIAGQVKTLMSLFTLVKCRSTKVLGIQLLITFMLIARSARCQVCLLWLPSCI